MTDARNLHAALLALAASAILSFIDNFVEPVSREAGLWQFQVVRTLFAIPLLLIFAWIVGASWRPVEFRAVAFRSAAVSTGLLIYFGTLAALPVAQAGAGLFSAPIWVLLFSALLFGSRISGAQVIAIPAGFVGVLIMLQIDPSALSLLSVLPLAAGAFYGFGMLLTRHWCHAESALALAIGIFVTMGLASAALLAVFTIWPVGGESAGFAMRGWVDPSVRFLILTFGQAVGAVVAVTLIAQAYRIGTPAYVAVFEYSFLVFACLWAFLLRGDTIGSSVMIGIAIIILSGMVLSLFGTRRS